jgi:CDGSH-type Zn-finger protein
VARLKQYRLSFRAKSSNRYFRKYFRDVSTSAEMTFRLTPMAQVTIETIKNGPYIVTGEVELIDSDGNKFPVEKRMALCRCGASTEKPFCDGTHSKIGFKAAEKAVPESKE